MRCQFPISYKIKCKLQAVASKATWHNSARPGSNTPETRSRVQKPKWAKRPLKSSHQAHCIFCLGNLFPRFLSSPSLQVFLDLASRAQFLPLSAIPSLPLLSHVPHCWGSLLVAEDHWSLLRILACCWGTGLLLLPLYLSLSMSASEARHQCHGQNALVTFIRIPSTVRSWLQISGNRFARIFLNGTIQTTAVAHTSAHSLLPKNMDESLPSNKIRKCLLCFSSLLTDNQIS